MSIVAITLLGFWSNPAVEEDLQIAEQSYLEITAQVLKE